MLSRIPRLNYIILLTVSSFPFRPCPGHGLTRSSDRRCHRIGDGDSSQHRLPSRPSSFIVHRLRGGDGPNHRPSPVRLYADRWSTDLDSAATKTISVQAYGRWPLWFGPSPRLTMNDDGRGKDEGGGDVGFVVNRFFSFHTI